MMPWGKGDAVTMVRAVLVGSPDAGWVSSRFDSDADDVDDDDDDDARKALETSLDADIRRSAGTHQSEGIVSSVSPRNETIVWTTRHGCYLGVVASAGGNNILALVTSKKLLGAIANHHLDSNGRKGRSARSQQFEFDSLAEAVVDRGDETLSLINLFIPGGTITRLDESDMSSVQKQWTAMTASRSS